jgi:hypothetical protein
LLLFIQTAGAEKKTSPWDRFEPPPDKRHDWLQLTSGEWLKGDLKVMYNYSLEFDSDEMDLQTFDFEDVKRIRTRRPQRVLVETGFRQTEVLTGNLVMNGGRIQLIDGAETNSFERTQVISIAGGAKREIDNWSGMFSVGATVRGGNTETADVTTMANLRRRTAISRFNVDYLANYSEAQQAETANNQRLNGFFDWFLTSRFYWQVLAGEYYRDPFTNIDHQYSLSTGVGYDLIRTSRTEWSMGAGAGYQQLQFDSVTPPDDDTSDSPFGTFGTRFDTEVTGSIDYLFDYSARFLNSSNGKYTHHLVTTLSFEFIGDLDLDLSLIWDRIEKPQAAGDGSLPKRDDYQTVISLAYDF